jgi:AcrR family transcriptional regulator
VKSARRPSKAKSSPRIRRSPDEARGLILEAAKKLVREKPPDAIGLKDVAREAGVSHALVTHYFGTIDALIDASLESLAEANRQDLFARIQSSAGGGPRAWMEQYFAWVMRPEAARLLAWTYLTGKTARSDFFSKRTRGLKKTADLLEARFAGELDVSREEIELALMLLMTSSFGYAIGRSGFWGGLGVDKPGAEQDQAFLGSLADVIESLMERRRKK